jgi:hypothetical protein
LVWKGAGCQWGERKEKVRGRRVDPEGGSSQLRGRGWRKEGGLGPRQQAKKGLEVRAGGKKRNQA